MRVGECLLFLAIALLVVATRSTNLLEDYEMRCPWDPSDSPAAWPRPGDVDRFFASIANGTLDSSISHLETTILSSPLHYELSSPVKGPWIVSVDNFLSKMECQRLIDLGYSRGYKRSEVVGQLKADGKVTGTSSNIRNSSNSYCFNSCERDKVIQDVSKRIESLVSIPYENFELIQLLRYEEGEYYGLHHDYLEYTRERQTGPPALTVLLYLNDVPEGGGTHFPVPDLTIQPQLGRLVIWPNVLNKDPMARDDQTQHQSMPVKRGRKYAANIRIFQRNFRAPLAKKCQ